MVAAQRRLRSAVVREADRPSRPGPRKAPPKGTLYHYPNPHNHQTLSIAAAPAPHKIAEQIYTQAIQTKMVVRHFKGEAMDKTLAWAAKRGRRLHAQLGAGLRNGRGTPPPDGVPVERQRIGQRRREHLNGRHRRPQVRRRHDADSRSSLHKLMQRKSTIAFLMALPLILLIADPGRLSGGLRGLSRDAEQVDDHASSASAISTFLFGRDTFWMVV